MVLLHVGDHILEAVLQAAHLGADDNHSQQGADAEHHDNPLNKVCLQGGHIASQHQNHRRTYGDQNHAYCFINIQQHRTNAGQALIHRGGVGQQKNKNNDAGKELHRLAVIPHFEQLGHRFDFQSSGTFPGPFCQHEPSQKGAEHRVAKTHQARPQPIAPSRAAGIADKHYRGKVGCAVRQGRNPRPCIASSYRKRRHALAVFGI